MKKIKNLFPIISVIIPTFNRKLWLTLAIDSILQQSWQNFELLIIDDGSTDGTKDLVAQYGDKLKYYYQSNQGPSAARNLGIHKSTGDYLCFLDSDDRWLTRKLATQAELIRSFPEVKICYTDEIWIRRGVRVNQKKIHRKYSGWIYPHCLPLCIISPSSVLVHREVFNDVGLFDESLIACEDYDLWLRISNCYPITFIDEPLIEKYGGHADQLSRKFWGMDKFRVKALEKMLRTNQLSAKNRHATIEMLYQKCDILSNGFFKRGKIDEANFYQQLKLKYPT